jgi:hypothetical protein
MAYDSTDLANVEAAIRSLTSGTQTVRLTMGDKSIEYARADLKALRELKSEILNEMQTAEAIPRYFVTRTSKGL